MRYTPISELYRQVRERKLTPQEIEDREKIAKKLPMDDFKKRYGKDAMAVKMATATNIVKAKSEVKEDGHTDVASAIRQCKTVTEDAMQILQKLKSMSPEDSLPSWWTNKLAVASNSMNKLRDYFLVPSVSEEVELNEAEVSVYGFISTGARKKFLDNLNDMRLQFKSKVMNLPQPAPPSGVLKFDANQSTIEAIIKFAKRMKLKVIKEEVELDEKAGDVPDLQKLIGELQNASKMHLAQSKRVQAHVDMMTRANAKGPEGAGGLQDLKKIVGELEKASQAHLRQSKSIDAHVGFMNKMEEVKLDETIVDFDYSRNPKAIFNAFLQMSRRLNLTLFNAPTGMKDLQSKGTGRIGGTKQHMLKFMKYLNSKGIEPKVEIINEQRSATGYTLFHRSFSDAMQHAYSFARVKMGMIVDPKEIDNKVATGPKKPGTGKTNSYSLKTNKGMLQIQVYNTGSGAKPFELNMYSS